MKIFFKILDITSKKAKQLGYTLVELSISTTIIAMIAVGGLTIMSKKDEADKVKITEARLARIESALQGFIRTNRYIPCPATPSLLESNTLFGTSVSYNTTTKICNGASLANATGAVPVRTLNLSDEYAYDGWNRKFAFRTATSSGAAADFDTITFHGNISITDRKGIQKTNINELPPNNNGAIYVIISYGSNGKNVAYRKNDTTTPPSQATGVESKNTDHTVNSYIQAPKSDTFDDIVVYGMKKGVILPKNITSPIKFDALSCENAHAIVAAGRSDLNTYAALGATELANANQIFANAQKIAYLCENETAYSLAPNDISDLTFWLDGSDSSTIFTAANCTGAVVNGSLIMCWQDKSTNAKHATNAVANTTRPTYVTGVQNNLGAVRFDGSNDYLATVSTLGSVFFTANEMSLFLVSGPTNNVGGRAPIGIDATGAGSRLLIVSEAGYSYFYRFDYPNDSTGSIRAATYKSNAWNVASFLKSTTRQYIYINGSLDISQANTLSLNTANSGQMFIGAGGGGSSTPNNYFLGDIGEVAIYKHALTDTERRNIQNYLSDKWNISNSSPTLCANGLSFLKTKAHPEGTCQCTNDNVLFQELSDINACSYGNGVIFNGCKTSSSTTAPTYSSPPTTTGMTLWLDANDCTTIKLADNTAKVSQWNDKSPSGTNFTQAFDSQRPTYTLAAINSKPSIHFTGKYLSTASLPGSTFFSATESTSFLVSTPTSATLERLALIWRTSNTNRYAIGRDFSHVFYFDNPNVTVNSGRLMGTISVDSRWSIYSFVKNSTGQYIYNNGTLESSQNTSSTLDTSVSTPMYIGMYDGGGFYFLGDMAEILIYNRALSTTERNGIESYLGTKYNIFIDPVSSTTAISNTLQLWLDATDTSKVFTGSGCTGVPSDGSSVGCWMDKSTNSYNAAQATATAQPTFKKGILKGRDAIMFDGTSDSLVAPVPFGTSAQTSTTIFSVLQSEVANPAAFEAVYTLGNAANVYTFAILPLFFGLNDYVSTTYKGRTIGAQGVTSPLIYALQFTESDTGAGMKMWINGVEPVYTTGGTITSRLFADGFVIGSVTGAASPASVDLGEIIIYNGNISDTDRKKVELYLSTKWGIAITQ
jgi:type II secretory pathway pseudopilin PulG